MSEKAVMTFDALRQANMARLPKFKNKKGEPAHSEPDGSDWALSTWMNATAGEAGELAEALLFMAMIRSLGNAGNRIKKIERGDLTLDEAREKLAGEFADVVTYLDILAFRSGIDLGEAVRDTFNNVSHRVKADVLLVEELYEPATRVKTYIVDVPKERV